MSHADLKYQIFDFITQFIINSRPFFPPENIAETVRTMFFSLVSKENGMKIN